MRGYRQLKNLKGRVVVITGASSGLGEQFAYQAAREGAIVVGCARRQDKLDQVARQCQHLSGQPAYGLAVDMTDPAQIQAVIAQVEREIGPIAVLINNAGFGLMEDFLNFDMATAEKMMRVNVLGLMYATQEVALKMTERQYGAIINVASMAGKMATPKSTVYSATKFAVLGFSNALRLELKPLGISVLTVNPGPIVTNFFNIADKSGQYLAKLGKIVLQPEDVAAKVLATVGTSRREVNLPGIMEVGARLYSLFPGLGDVLAGGLFNKK